MSSHHIVREKQEPALLVLSLYHFDDELLGQLLEWSPTVMATSLTAEQIHSQGIKVDIVIADELDASMQSDVKLIPTNGDPLKAAMTFLLAGDYKAVNIITDGLLLDDLAPYASRINLVIFSAGQKIYPITPGFSKWKPAGEHIRILSDPENINVEGLIKTGDGIYLTSADGFFTINFDGKFLFIAEDV